MLRGSSFVTGLERAGYRVTGPRRAIAELIAVTDGPFTAADLANSAATGSMPIGRATIFRALDVFTALGLVERIDLPSGSHVYVTCDPSHHHHAVCGRCGRTVPVADLGIDTLLAGVSTQTGFRIDGHRLEVYGTCASCLAAEQRDESAVPATAATAADRPAGRRR